MFVNMEVRVETRARIFDNIMASGSTTMNLVNTRDAITAPSVGNRF